VGIGSREVVSPVRLHFRLLHELDLNENGEAAMRPRAITLVSDTAYVLVERLKAVPVPYAAPK
jgi:hypothetical protein